MGKTFLDKKGNIEEKGENREADTMEEGNGDEFDKISEKKRHKVRDAPIDNDLDVVDKKKEKEKKKKKKRDLELSEDREGSPKAKKKQKILNSQFEDKLVKDSSNDFSTRDSGTLILEKNESHNNAEVEVRESRKKKRKHKKNKDEPVGDDKTVSHEEQERLGQEESGAMIYDKDRDQMKKKRKSDKKNGSTAEMNNVTKEEETSSKSEQSNGLITEGIEESKKEKKKKKKKQSSSGLVAEGTEESKKEKKKKKKKQSNGLATEGSEESKKEKKKKKQSNDLVAEGAEESKKEKRKKEKKPVKNSVTENKDTPDETGNSKLKSRSKKVTFSDQVDVCYLNEASKPVKKSKRVKKSVTEKKDTQHETETSKLKSRSKKVTFSDQVDDCDVIECPSNLKRDEDGIVRGQRFSIEEDNLITDAVLGYVESHQLGEEGVQMLLKCKSEPRLRNCWKDIGKSLPWRPYVSVYYRAHNLFERDERRPYTPEELELIRRHHEKHGSNWKELAGALGKHRVHLKDTWRRIRLPNQKSGHWSREEYQSLFDLVNMDLRMKAMDLKISKHGMLRDNIPWEAISDKLETRQQTACCIKWYKQLTSSMVDSGEWDNADDYRLLDALLSLDACCIEDVEWDTLIEGRSGYVCLKRWNQMVPHIGVHGTHSFAEQVEILSKRYNPELEEPREEFDNRPYDD